jgi:predicted house-cleaning noncanonical NTP pyrophosphatase (MazG superfamily)
MGKNKIPDSRKDVASQDLFPPLNSVVFISEATTFSIAPNFLHIESVGEKAFGLSCLPSQWTLPFVVVSDKLCTLYKELFGTRRQELITQWADRIVAALLSVDVKESDTIIVRSSGCAEGLEERGKYHSKEGMFNNLEQVLSDCLNILVSDADLRDQKIPLVIQKYILPISARGHLSNERRFSQEHRDWLGQFEDIRTKLTTPFPISLRNWRKKIPIINAINRPLYCNLSAHVAEVLKIPATWAYDKKLRLHFEWVWDGHRVFIVQADREQTTDGIDPRKIQKSRATGSTNFSPTCLQQITDEHAKKYNKIRNVFTYRKLGLPIGKLFILDDQSVINDLAEGKDVPNLEKDIKELVKGSLVIRMDIATEDYNLRQLLPRTEEVREFSQALQWLKEKVAEIKKHNAHDNVAFIFHNFIPAVASAFALAAPNERKVQIEALWGLPEGLYYNAHDKYVVDTHTRRSEDLKDADVHKYLVIHKENYKHFFVTPDELGHWTLKVLKPPYDWLGSIEKEDWIKEIAFHSRRIAEEEKKALSIMWFIDVSMVDNQAVNLPWYHEAFDGQKSSRAQTQRKKTPFDKDLTIKTSEDIDRLSQEATKEHSTLRRIRIQLREEKLLRDKDTLKRIGELSKKIHAIILLEGGVLSHPYYQLMKTSAIVEVLHPFDESEDRREFNKLVRDKVPSNIEHGGEVVQIAKLTKESLLRALREKLVEEVYEVLDAVDQESLLGELADVSEIIDGILVNIQVSKEELNLRQRQKREKAGGFKDGMVLLDTRNPLLTQKTGSTEETLFDQKEELNSPRVVQIDDQKLIELSHKLDKWSDKREHQAATEEILRLTIPMVLDNWQAETPVTIIDGGTEKMIRSEIIGRRTGSKLQINLSIFTPREDAVSPSNQLELTFDQKSPGKG